MCGRFGRRLFEIFFKTYSEKLWGIPCSELDADFAAQRIKKFSLGEAIRGAFASKKRSAHRTLADEFAYPVEGTGTVYERMAKAIEERGGQIQLRTSVSEVLTRGDRVQGIRLQDGTVREYDHVISTMPLTRLVQRLPDVPATVLEASRGLSFRNTIIVYLEIARSDLFPDHWIYLHSPDLKAGRVTNFRNWSPLLHGGSPNTILAVEYWCNEADEIWGWEDGRLADLATREIVAAGLVFDESLVKNSYILRIPKCYPVFRRGYRKLLRPIRDYLRTIKCLQVIGRYGSFKYNNQDHSILMGILAAENILKGSGHDLWSVNCDYEVYQEACRITETGLVSEPAV